MCFVTEWTDVSVWFHALPIPPFPFSLSSVWRLVVTIVISIMRWWVPSVLLNQRAQRQRGDESIMIRNFSNFQKQNQKWTSAFANFRAGTSEDDLWSWFAFINPCVRDRISICIQYTENGKANQSSWTRQKKKKPACVSDEVTDLEGLPHGNSQPEAIGVCVVCGMCGICDHSMSKCFSLQCTDTHTLFSQFSPHLSPNMFTASMLLNTHKNAFSFTCMIKHQMDHTARTFHSETPFQ